MANEQEKIDGSDVKIKLSSPFLEKLENFWFYHKWKVIIGAFFLIVIGVGVFQMATKEKYDTQITVATHTIYYEEHLVSFEKALTSFMPGDVNGDGKKNLAVFRYKIFSEDELKAANEVDTDQNGNPIIYADPDFNREQITDLNSSIASGQCTVMFLSKSQYDAMVDKRDEDVLLLPMSELFGGEMPNGVADNGYGILLREIDAYKLEGFNWLPSDTVICILHKFPTVSQERYDADKALFVNIVEFGK